jgi:GTP-binding protein HflX
MMAESIGYEVVGTLIQKRKSVHHSYTIGPGRLKDLESLVEDERADTVIFANPLTSSHVFNLTQHLGGDVRVIDRNLLILEVFDKRAFTNEAKLQIRLAKLKYTLSWGREFIKLRGIMGEQLGWMGPGDYPYQEYYRAARNRISRIEDELQDIYKKKMLKRDRRRELGFPIVALAGYTQAGKTSFFNLVAHEEKSVGLGPFTTLTTFARKATTGLAEEGSEFIIIDSIGFIEDMHPIILKAFHATLGELATADLVLLFVDASDEPFPLERKVRSCSQILREVDVTSPIIICANKVDKISEQLEESKAIIRKYFPNEEIIPLSVKTGQALDSLLAMIGKQLQSLKITVKQGTPPRPD